MASKRIDCGVIRMTNEMKLQLKFKGHGQSEKPSNQSNK